MFAAAFYLYWSIDDSWTELRRGRLVQAVAALVLAVLISLVVRPWIAWPAPALNPSFRPLYPSYFWGNGSPDSFPSHSTLAYFTIAAGLWPLSRRVSLALSGAVLGLVVLPRVYVGGHYPVDVVAALALTAGALPLAWRWHLPQPLAKWLIEKGPRTAGRELLLILFVFELGEGFKGSTYLLANIRHYLLR